MAIVLAGRRALPCWLTRWSPRSTMQGVDGAADPRRRFRGCSAWTTWRCAVTRYATVVIDAVTHRGGSTYRSTVSKPPLLPSGWVSTLALRSSAATVPLLTCREVIRQGAPKAVQVSDRWHRGGPGAAVEKTVIAHAPAGARACRARPADRRTDPSSARGGARAARSGHRATRMLPPPGLCQHGQATLRAETAEQPGVRPATAAHFLSIPTAITCCWRWLAAEPRGGVVTWLLDEIRELATPAARTCPGVTSTRAVPPPNGAAHHHDDWSRGS
ncbi:hypothetical protein HBB16_13615 [Pseudonocardia sp. MCCB 268]|nr:hypothetical protein [Pseudonocardia cytotoxica]